MNASKTVIMGITGELLPINQRDLVSRLYKVGTRVHVIMTPNAMQFIAPLTFRTLSGNPVLIDSFQEDSRWRWHIGLAEEDDLMV